MQEQEKDVMERARHDAEQGKSASTQAGEFVREEMHHVREGKHGAQSAEQAIAIGLSKARRAGVKLPVPKRGKVSSRTRAQAERDLRMGRRHRKHRPSKARSRSTSAALRREGKAAASPTSLSRHARVAAGRRGSPARHRSAVKALRTKGKAGLKRAARKAARTRRAG